MSRFPDIVHFVWERLMLTEIELYQLKTGATLQSSTV